MTTMERSFYCLLIAVLSILLLLSRACQKTSLCTKKHCDKNDTVTIVTLKRDTVEIVRYDSTGWHTPKPIKLDGDSGSQIKGVNAEVPDQFTILTELKKDSVAKADYFTLRQYSDTNQVDGGTIIVENKVYMNRLATQRVISHLNQNIITEERIVTNNVKEPSKGQLFIGPIAQGWRNDPISSFGAQAAWKTKGNRIWIVSVLYNKPGLTEPASSGKMLYQIGHLFKLPF